MVRQRAVAEVRTASRFTVVGLFATGVHVGTVWGLVKISVIAPLIANLVAYLCAFAVSFTGQYLWTFRSTRSPFSALWRFLIVSLTAFAINNAVLITLLDARLLPGHWAAAVAVGVIPPITYVLSRTWAMR